jgi:hypothetical protein
MLVLEAKLEGTKEQYEKLNEAIRTCSFCSEHLPEILDGQQGHW